MNLTLSVDEEVVERAREVARARGTSVNQLVRDYLEQLAGRRHAPEELAARFAELSKQSGGRSDGTAWTREDVYDGERFGGPRVRR